MENKTKSEIILLALCGATMNGYSKSFRKLLLDRNQDERIELMTECLRDSKIDGSYEEGKKLLKELMEVI